MSISVRRWGAAALIIVSCGWAAPSAAQSDRPASASSLGLTRSSNPALGVNALFLGVGTDGNAGNAIPDNELLSGLHIQEVEIGLTGAVDPYFRGTLLLSIEGTEGIEIEESYVTLLALPSGWGARIGKLYAPFGKHNQLHEHAFPFIDAPLIHTSVFGAEGANEIGVEAHYLLPLPWYAQATAAVFNGDNALLFDSDDGEDLAYAARLYNQWDASDDTTLELGASYLGGAGACVRREEAGGLTDNTLPPPDDIPEDIAARTCTAHVIGGDLTVKYLPASRRSLTWQTEYLFLVRTHGGTTVERTGGLASWLQYRFAHRWWAQGRLDVMGLPAHDLAGALEPLDGAFAGRETPYRLTTLLAFVPTEFSAVRVQYSYFDDGVTTENRVMLQLNVTFGAHPAHSY